MCGKYTHIANFKHRRRRRSRRFLRATPRRAGLTRSMCGKFDLFIHARDVTHSWILSFRRAQVPLSRQFDYRVQKMTM